MTKFGAFDVKLVDNIEIYFWNGDSNFGGESLSISLKCAGKHVFPFHFLAAAHGRILCCTICVEKTQ